MPDKVLDAALGETWLSCVDYITVLERVESNDGDKSDGRRVGGVGCRVASLSENPVARFEHEIGERLTLSDRGHALQLDDLLSALYLYLFGAAHLRLVLGFELLNLVLKSLHVRVLVDTEVRHVMSRRVGRSFARLVFDRRIGRVAPRLVMS